MPPELPMGGAYSSKYPSQLSRLMLPSRPSPPTETGGATGDPHRYYNGDVPSSGNNKNLLAGGTASMSLSGSSMGSSIRGSGGRHRGKLKKAQSRTDLVREMALDRAAGGGDLNRSWHSVGAASLAASSASGGGISTAEIDSVPPLRRATSALMAVPAASSDALGTASIAEDPSLLGTTPQASGSSSSASEARRGANFMQGFFPNQNQQYSMQVPQPRRQEPYTVAEMRALRDNTTMTGETNDVGSVNVNGTPVKSNGGTTPATVAEKKQPSATQTQRPAGGAGAPRHPNGCERCEEMEATLLAVQADFEYLRTLELQKEFVCGECEKRGQCGGENASIATTNRSAKQPTQQQQPQQANILQRQNSSQTQQSVSSAVSVGSRGSRSSRLVRRRPRSSAAAANIGLADPAHLYQSAGASVNGGSTKSGRMSRLSRNSTTLLRDASNRLSDLSIRHKRQVKQTTHDRAYWQNDMHLKLEKFAMMCKNLNEEAAQRSNEAKEAKSMLDKATIERNAFASQVQTLQARVALYEDECAGHARLREEWEGAEEARMDGTDEAVAWRNEALSDLTSRLELAMETLESERKQQRQRRQIIFPSSRTPPPAEGNGGGHNRTNSNEFGNAPASPYHRSNSAGEPPRAELERLQRSKEMARKAQLSLRVAMTQSATREWQLQSRCDKLEKELAAAQSVLASVGGDKSGSQIDVDLCMEAGVSLRRATSISSL